MIEIFAKGGPVMWPLLATSLAALTVVLERLLFVVRESRSRQPELVERIFADVERGDWSGAPLLADGARDRVARVLGYALEHRGRSLSNALLRASARELGRFARGLALLDTAITVAPLLGLLGTVTGMIHAFGLIGGRELEAPAAITGGIAEALIATAFGLGIAITALLPFNFLTARLEEARQELEDAATRLELLISKPGPPPA
jgi:biopolymer transport protein ExbB